MKREEKIAQTYLKHLGYQDIVYEPNGNIPPDFLLNGKIAIEVRRLNQHYKSESRLEPLESLDFKLIPKIYSILKEYQHKQASKTVAVCIDFERPLKVSNVLFKMVRNTLDKYLSEFGQRKTIHINKNLALSFFPLDGNLGPRLSLLVLVMATLEDLL